uniref:helix-turn-helix domain-containing protein n=1 Tax=Salinispora fenicalii TaxID=1137263 RepID=UPI0004B27D6E|nr:helix-turn-helix domain-containing protein [Salinispora fenicalii]
MKLRRAIVVLMSAQGQPAPDIAYLLKASEDYVRNVIHAFNEWGFDALGPKTERGAARQIVEQNRVGIVQGRRAAATGPGGFLSELVKTVLGRGLRAEHLGYVGLGCPRRWRSCRILAPAVGSGTG